jgi:hypothetical protein
MKAHNGWLLNYSTFISWHISEPYRWWHELTADYKTTHTFILFFCLFEIWSDYAAQASLKLLILLLCLLNDGIIDYATMSTFDFILAKKVLSINQSSIYLSVANE